MHTVARRAGSGTINRVAEPAGGVLFSRNTKMPHVILRFRLPDEEREAIAFGIACVTTDKHAATLRHLLERLHT